MGIIDMVLGRKSTLMLADIDYSKFTECGFCGILTPDPREMKAAFGIPGGSPDGYLRICEPCAYVYHFELLRLKGKSNPTITKAAQHTIDRPGWINEWYSHFHPPLYHDCAVCGGDVTNCGCDARIRRS